MNQINLPLVDELTKECEKLRGENAELRRRLGLKPDEAVFMEESNIAEAVKENTISYSMPEKLNTSEKLKIFTNLFRGRRDIYAIRKKN